MGGPNLEVFKVSIHPLPAFAHSDINSRLVRHVHHVPDRHHVLLRHKPGFTLRCTGLLAQAWTNAHSAIRTRGDFGRARALEAETIGDSRAEDGGRAERRAHTAL